MPFRYQHKLLKLISKIIIKNEIDFRCLAILKVARFSTKLYCLIELTYSKVSALAKKPKDVNTKVRDQRSANAEAESHQFVAKVRSQSYKEIKFAI